MKNSKPLPLSDALRDLALLRVSDIDLSSVLHPSRQPSSHKPSESQLDNGVNVSVERSFEFVREARSAVRMYYRGDVEVLGTKVDEVRDKIEDVLKGLQGDV